MKRFFILIVALLAFAQVGFGSSHGPCHSRNPHASKKSHVSGRDDGHFNGGHGRSYKGGHYSNGHTGNHYRDRKHGVN
jgi:hypothetical protein